jgi:hypothetical protein
MSEVVVNKNVFNSTIEKNEFKSEVQKVVYAGTLYNGNHFVASVSGIKIIDEYYEGYTEIVISSAPPANPTKGQLWIQII